MTDLMTIFFDTVNQPRTKNGMLMTGKISDNSMSATLLSRIDIPVTPPSKKPFGKRKAFRPILASRIATANCENSHTELRADLMES